MPAPLQVPLYHHQVRTLPLKRSGHLSLTFSLFRGRTEGRPIPLSAEQSQPFFGRSRAHGPLCELCVQRARSRAICRSFLYYSFCYANIPLYGRQGTTRQSLRYALGVSDISGIRFHSFRRGDFGDGGKMLFLSAWNTVMHESNATCTFQQRSHPMINLRPDPNASVPGGNPQSSSFEEAACIKTSPNEPMGRRNRAEVMQIRSWRLFPVFCCMECLCR